MAEVAFRPVRQLSEYKGKGASASREEGFRKAEAKAESSGLCQSCRAEGVRVSVAEEKKNIYGFQQ